MSKKTKKSIDSICIGSIEEEEFYGSYISSRTPVKLKNVNHSNKLIFDCQFDVKNLVQNLGYDEPLMVEQKSKNGFGNGGNRVKMRLGELMERFERGEDGWYLTTQYREDPTEGSSDSDSRDEDDEDEEDEDEEEDDIDDLDNDNDTDTDAYDLDVQLNQHVPVPIQIPDPIQTTETDESDFDFENLKDDYEDSDEDQDQGISDQERLRELFQPPLTNIHKQFPLKLPFFKPLVPQQINLWLGYVNDANLKPVDDIVDSQDITSQSLGKYIPKGTSSGLHHDQSDNLYILVCGRKRFTLYSPFDAYKLYTVGNVLNIYDNGVINYATDERAPDWSFINDDGSINDSKLVDDEKHKMLKSINAKLNIDPPNFSTVPPLLLHLDELPQHLKEKLVKFTNRNFENIIKLTKYEVWLDPGDMLYLPAGWFHEVSSFNDIDGYHLALNYWFAPPNTTNFKKPYKSDYWAKDFEITNQIINHCA